ncbi:hypothetical protein EYF80_058531 [Liparis tanakae]|uniref:Uncharacterized protein n=1 Tax=Liparis tanakae TaxID=230148 RepID=A0A4Z2EQY8_9TELE|nr:hypothetical protein EYF80_058531 [Liparis tanakae]
MRGGLKRHHLASRLRNVDAEHQTHTRVLSSNVRLTVPQFDVGVPQLQDPYTVNPTEGISNTLVPLIILSVLGVVTVFPDLLVGRPDEDLQPQWSRALVAAELTATKEPSATQKGRESASYALQKKCTWTSGCPPLGVFTAPRLPSVS